MVYQPKVVFIFSLKVTISYLLHRKILNYNYVLHYSVTHYTFMWYILFSYQNFSTSFSTRESHFIFRSPIKVYIILHTNLYNYNNFITLRFGKTNCDRTKLGASDVFPESNYTEIPHRMMK